MPARLGDDASGVPLPARVRAQLRCPACGGWARPHVLWFDETYDEPRYRFSSALQAAGASVLLLTVGTSGATTLPALVAERAAAAGATLVDVNPEPNPFADLARRTGGVTVRAPAVEAVPPLVAAMVDGSQVEAGGTGTVGPGSPSRPPVSRVPAAALDEEATRWTWVCRSGRS